ncbi:MAG: hypothetical protein EB082_13680 [Verrucomicrobia bacterium]|nr:hypothetical protein [Verrucomicrobiota bacterium]
MLMLAGGVGRFSSARTSLSTASLRDWISTSMSRCMSSGRLFIRDKSPRMPPSASISASLVIA